MVDLSTSLTEARAIRADLARALGKCRGLKFSGIDLPELEEALVGVNAEIENTQERVLRILDDLERTGLDLGLRGHHDSELDRFADMVGDAVYAIYQTIESTEWNDEIEPSDIIWSIEYADKLAQELVRRLAKVSPDADVVITSGE
jgi:hypothetical protein